ncbi:rubrerythrin-like domain-containing protein [Natrinema hispanicum]|uniref:rubrerythrin-like domain-containing protein n=1 Tax=Natrinema hispanicum TaxID=392421 RepID=UPI00102C90BB|nr:rubrerythrin-like domain-containing protein [Natrinema hispanicum]
MYDIRSSSDTTSTYECLSCGEIVSTDTGSKKCARCGRANTFQNGLCRSNKRDL